GGVVQPGILEAARLQVGDAKLGVLDHPLLGAELDRAGRADLGAGRRLAYRDAVGAQRALVGLVVLLRDPRHVERAAGDAVAAADAVLLVEIHDTVGVLHDCTGGRTGLQAARVLAVHAAVL